MFFVEEQVYQLVRHECTLEGRGTFLQSNAPILGTGSESGCTLEGRGTFLQSNAPILGAGSESGCTLEGRGTFLRQR